MTFKWWVFIAAIKSFISAVYECLKPIEGRDTIIAEKYARLVTLSSEIKSMDGIIVPLCGVKLLTVVGEMDVVATHSNTRGTFLVPNEMVINFLEDASFYTSEDLETINEQVHRDIIKKVWEMLMAALMKVSSLEAKRSNDNSPSLHVVPSVLPAQLYCLHVRQFSDIISTQKKQLTHTGDAAHILGLEDQFRGFQWYVTSSPSAPQDVRKYGGCLAGEVDVF